MIIIIETILIQKDEDVQIVLLVFELYSYLQKAIYSTGTYGCVQFPTHFNDIYIYVLIV